MAVMGLGVRGAGRRELRRGKWVRNCVTGGGREGSITTRAAVVLLPSALGRLVGTNKLGTNKPNKQPV